MDIHHGQILKQAALVAGYNAVDLALLTGANKKTIEGFFKNKLLPGPVLYQIGLIIGRDFSKEFPNIIHTESLDELIKKTDLRVNKNNGAAKIFLVDDKEIDVIIFKILLDKVQKDVDIGIFHDGDSAINKLLEISINDTQALPEHIFLDLNMPVMDGHSFLENFTRLCIDPNRKVKIHILTSSVFYSEKTKLKLNPLVDNFISKPIDVEQIKNILIA